MYTKNVHILSSSWPVCKFIEFRKHYGHIIPDLHRKNLKSIEKKINEKHVRDFRNKCVGHILDERTKRPIPHSEIINFLTNFGSIADLLNWINDKAPGSAANVVRANENARDELCLIYNIKPEEVLNR